MFLLLIPSITALVTGFRVMGDGGNCVISGAARRIFIECGVPRDALFSNGIALPEPLVSWGLVVLGAAVTYYVLAYYRAKMVQRMALFRRRSSRGNELLEGFAYRANQEEEQYRKLLAAHPEAIAAIKRLKDSRTADELFVGLGDVGRLEDSVQHAHFRLEWLATAIEASVVVVANLSDAPDATARLLYSIVLVAEVQKAGGPAIGLLEGGRQGRGRAQRVLNDAMDEALRVAASPAEEHVDAQGLESRLRDEEQAIALDLAQAYPALTLFPPFVVSLLTGRVALMGSEWLEEVTRAASKGQLVGG